MQEYITLYDYLLLPFYLLLFFFIVRKKAKKYEGTGLKKIFFAAFWLRMAGAIFYGLLIQYYYGYGDSFGFYLGGNMLSHMIQHDISSLKYLFASGNEIIVEAKAMGLADEAPASMPIDSNAFVMKVSAIISFFTFNKYLIISVCFGFFSFIGIWKLFYIFYELNSKKHKRLLAIFVIYFPSCWFWGSGLLKESLCIGALGILLGALYKMFISKQEYIKNVILIICMLYILLMVKSYIIAILAVSAFIGISAFLIGKIKTKFIKIGFITGFLISAYFIIVNLDTSIIDNFVNDSFRQIKTFQSSYQAVQMEDESSKATFSLSDINPTLQGILLNAPMVIGTCLFRPFPWEAKKIIMFFSSLEALVTLFATVYLLMSMFVIKFFKYVFEDPVNLFCFIFCLLFALLIGYTTFNFGTMVRYKIIFLPFYFFMLIHIYTAKQDHAAAKATI